MQLFGTGDIEEVEEEEALLSTDKSRWKGPKEEELLRWVQSFKSKPLDYFAIFCAYLLAEDVMVLLVIFLLLVDPYYILPFALWFLVQEMCNGLLKFIFQHPRPFFAYEDVRIIDSTLEKGFSFPSSHAQGYSFLAFGLTLTYGWIFWTIILYPLSIAGSLTRVYLGLHFVHDVVAGWILALFWTFVWYESRTMEEWFDTPQPGRLVFIMCCVAIIPLAFYSVLKFVPPWPTDQIQRWEDTCHSNSSKHIPLQKRSFDSYMAFYALLIGALVGLELNIRENVIAYYFEVFRTENLHKVWPRIFLGLVLSVVIVVCHEVVRKSDFVHKLEQPHRTAFLFTPPFILGLCMTLTIPILSEYYDWMN